MQCERIVKLLGEHLEGRLDAATSAEVASHLRDCASCQAAEVRRRRFDLMLDAFELGAEAQPAPRSLARVAAALCLGLALGAAIAWAILRGGPPATNGSPSENTPVIPSAPGGHEFLLALLEPPPSTPPPSEPMRDVIAAYSGWAQSLARDGRLVAAEKLRDDQRTRLRPRDGAIETTAPPRAEDEPWLGGFFVLRARDLDEALELARGSPHLRYGGTIEVREIEKTE